MPTPVPMAAQAGDIINAVAAECGIAPVTDPFSEQDQTFQQLIYLLNIAGLELVLMFPWEQLQAEHAIATTALDTGDYALPTDFAYMINQTGWERAQNVPLGGPLSPQDWQYLLGRGLTTSTLYASFRLREGQFSIFPQPPPAGLDIRFEYVSKNWVYKPDTLVFTDSCDTFSDTPMYNRLVLSRYLKVKYLDSKGLDSSKAQDDFDDVFSGMTGQNMGAKVLDAGGYGNGVPLLGGGNVPFNGYG